MAAAANDRFGLGWRPQLAAGILANLDRIDIVEVIADDYFDAPSKHHRALATLAAQVPIALHGIGMGLASACRADQKRIDAMARLVERIQPESWSEHLAFVRAGEIEIGHLAAVPAQWRHDRQHSREPRARNKNHRRHTADGKYRHID